MPFRGRMVTKPSRASRCSASRTGVRPIPSVAGARSRPWPFWLAAGRPPDREARGASADERGTSNLPSFGDHRREFLVFRLVDRIRVIVVGERAFLDFLHILPNARNGNLGQLGIAFGELRLEVGKHAQKVVAKKDLAIAARPGPNANGGDGELL